MPQSSIPSVKESCRWIEGYERAQQFDYSADLLLRAQHNRALGDDLKLWDAIELIDWYRARWAKKGIVSQVLKASWRGCSRVLDGTYTMQIASDLLDG